MKKLLKKILFIYFCLTISVVCFAKDIYVGDLIKLKISNNISKKTLMKKFEKFELDDIKEEGDSYLVSFRIYQTGMHEIELGNSKLKIDVKSVLTDKDKDIAKNLTDSKNLELKKVKVPFPYEILLLIPSLILLYFIIKILKKNKKQILLTPIEEFNKNILELTNEEYFYQLSYSFRKYLDRKFDLNLLSGQYQKENYKLKNDTEEIIKQLDQYKFNPFSSIAQEKEKIRNKIIKIVEEIEKGEANA